MNKYFLCFLILIYSFDCLAAQDSSNYYIRHYTDENGLPQNSVKSIVTDEYGFVWLTTEDGLVRFDGTKFTSYGMEQLKVTSSRFQTFFTNTTDRALYTYTSNMGPDGQQEYVTIKNGQPVTAINARIIPQEAFFTDPATENSTPLNPLSYYLGIAGPKTTFKIRPGSNSFYKYTRDSISYFSGSKRLYQVPFYVKENHGFFTIDGMLYHFQDNGMLTCFTESDSIITRFTGDLPAAPSYKQGLKKIRIFRNACTPGYILFYADNNIYVATRNNNNSLSTRIVFPAISIDNIICAYYDTSRDKLYLGTYAKGFYILDKQPFKTLTTATVNTFYGLTPYRDNAILTPYGVLFNPSGKPELINKIHRNAPWDFYSIATDTYHNIWIKHGRQLYKHEPANFNITGTWKLPLDIALLNSGSNNRLWVALRDSNIYAINTTAKEATPAHFIGLSGPVTAIKEHKGKLYAGTSTGFYRISLAGKKVDTIQGLKGKYISSSYTDAADNTWITTHGKGFYLLQRDSVYAFPYDKHKFLSTAHCIVEDQKGFLWISTNKGLFQIAKKDLLDFVHNRQQIYYHYHDRTEGFNTNEFNGDCEPCGIMLGNGKISFPSLNGLVTFYPDSIPALLPDAPLFLDKVMLDDHDIPGTDLKQLPHHFNQLKFYISTPFMGNPANLHIEYALVRRNEEPVWLPLPEDGVITYNKLLSGDATLLARKQKGFGSNNYATLDIPLYINKTWYETTWFYIIAISALILSVWGIIRLRLRMMERRNDQLEEMIGLKTQELGRQVSIQNMIINAISHDVQTPLQYQAMLTQAVYDELEQRRQDSLSEPARVINEGTQRLQHMIGNLLKYLKSQPGNNNQNLQEETDLYSLAIEKVSIFESISGQRGTQIHNNIKPGMLIHADAQIISVILHNLLDNAVKVTRQGHIHIDANGHGDQYQVMIKDSGPGLPQHLQAWVNDAGQKKNNAAALAQQGHTTGIGLLMVKELVAISGLEIQVNVEPAGGTCFTITRS